MAKKDKRQIYFLVDSSGTVKDTFVAKDDDEASELALEKDKTYTAERVTSKNWRRVKDTLGEAVAKDFKTFRKQMSNAFEGMGLSSDMAETAARGRDLDPTATLSALGLSEVDFKDIEIDDLNESTEEDDPTMTEAEANEALSKAMARLGLDTDVDLKEYSSLLD